MDPRVQAGAAASHADVAPVPDFIQAWADANTKHEGWFPAGVSAAFPRGSVSWRHMNPGNLVLNGAYATFPTYAAGRKALTDDLTAKVRKYPTWTLLQVMERYCPPPDGTALNRGNNPVAYAKAVAAALGVSTDTPVSEIAVLWVKNDRKYVPAEFAQ